MARVLWKYRVEHAGHIALCKRAQVPVTSLAVSLTLDIVDNISLIKKHEINSIFHVQNGSGVNSLEKYFMKYIKIKLGNYPKNHKEKKLKMEIFKLPQGISFKYCFS